MSALNRSEISRVSQYAKDTLSGFKTFILRGNVVDLAIGIVIGAAFSAMVNAFVGDIITPLIPVGKANLSGLILPLPYGAGLKVGEFLNALISFLIVAAVLYFFIVRPVGVFMDHYKPHKVAVVEKHDCPYCLQAVPVAATRCAYCTSQISSVEQRETVNI